MIRRCAALVTVVFALASATLAQDVGPLPAVGDVFEPAADKVPAKKLFASKRSPADLEARFHRFFHAAASQAA